MNFETNLSIQTSFVIQHPLHISEGNKIRCSWYERPCYMHSLYLHAIYQFAPYHIKIIYYTSCIAMCGTGFPASPTGVLILL